jgi:hypothetical protein
MNIAASSQEKQSCAPVMSNRVDPFASTENPMHISRCVTAALLAALLSRPDAI